MHLLLHVGTQDSSFSRLRERRRRTSFRTPRFSLEIQDKLSVSGSFLLSCLPLRRRLYLLPSPRPPCFCFCVDAMKSSA